MFPNDTKILIIDDMATMRKILRKILTEMGFTNVSEADDGETAWPLIQEAVAGGSPYKLILSDWNMPKMRGIELLKKVRGDSATAATPFVLVTAEAEKTQVQEAVSWNVSSYIIKPFTPASVAEKLKALHAALSK